MINHYCNCNIFKKKTSHFKIFNYKVINSRDDGVIRVNLNICSVHVSNVSIYFPLEEALSYELGIRLKALERLLV